MPAVDFTASWAALVALCIAGIAVGGGDVGGVEGCLVEHMALGSRVA